MRSLQLHHIEQFSQIFGAKPTLAAHAPGRIEVIGNHTDYNGGRVMGIAVEQGILAMGIPRTDKQLRLHSLQGGKMVRTRIDQAQALSGDAAWANYPLGVVHALRAVGARIEHGFDLLFDSDLPAGAGMSSSAALELASAQLIASTCGFEADRATFAQIARAAENNFVGVPCGILDQGVSVFGLCDHLVRIDCRTEQFSQLPLPADLAFWIFNTCKKHSLLDSLYSKRHAECFEAFKLLAEGRPDAECLSDFSQTEVEAAVDRLPAEIYRRALHVVCENARVDALEAALNANDPKAIGECLLASHASSRDLFENSIPELDFLVDSLSQTEGVYGARLTGGGFGGAVMALTSANFSQAAAENVVELYRNEFGTACSLLKTNAADGAGVVRL